MPLIQATPLSELPPGSITEVVHADKTFAVCNVDGTIHCVDGICPHLEGPLAEGALHGNTIVCPWHGWEFDVRTGASDSVEDCRLNTYPAVVRDGNVFIQVD